MGLSSYIAVSLVLLLVVSAGGAAVPTSATTLADSTNDIDACTTITDPGQYKLTADLEENARTDRRACIVIRSGNVTLDGNGHVVVPADHDSVFVGTDLTQPAKRLPNVTIHDVVATRIRLRSTPGATVRNVSARDIQVSNGNGSVIADNTLTATKREGRPREGASISVFESGGTVVANNTVMNTTDLNRTSDNSIYVRRSENVTVRDNVVRSNTTGLQVQDVTNSTFADNTITGSPERALAVTWRSQGNVFEDTVVSDSVRGVFVSDSFNNTFRNTTANNTSDAVLDMRDAGPNRLERLRIGANTTVSIEGRNFVVRDVDTPPAVPSHLTAVDGYVNVIEYRGARVWLNMSYNETAVKAAGLNESDLRLYRHPAEEALSHVYAPMGSTTETESTAGWLLVPGTNGVNVTAHQVYASVGGFDFGDPDTPTSATQVDVGETVNGTIVSNEVDWYAFEVTAGKAILPRLNVTGPIKTRSIRLDIYGPDGNKINVYRAEAPGIHYVAGGPFGSDRQARGAAVAQENGTYYVRVSGDDFDDLVPDPYTLSVQTERIDAFEPNQQRETATQIEPNVTIHATTAGFDTDWYAFEVTAGSSIDITAEIASIDSLELIAALIGPTGEELDSVYFGTDRATLNATASQSGIYYVQIRQGPANLELFHQSQYELTANVSSVSTPCPNRDIETTTAKK